jgi:hypothetical protein
MEITERNFIRDLEIMDFIFQNKQIFKPLTIWKPNKIGHILQKNGFISRREFYRSNIWNSLVREGVFKAQSETYKYDRNKMFNVLNALVENDDKISKIIKIKKRYSGFAPLVPPNL